MSSSTICRPGTPEAVRGTPLVQADVGDTQAIRETIRRHRVSAVMHFAAFLDVGESVRMPSRYYANNVRQTLALLDAAVDESVQHVVFSSTCAVYGEPGDLRHEAHWALGAALAFSLAARYAQGLRSPKEPRAPLWRWVAGFLAANVLSNLLSPYPETVWADFGRLIAGCALLLFPIALVTRWAFVRAVPLVISGSVTLASVFAITGYLFGLEPFVEQIDVFRRATGGSSSPNTLALLIILCIPLLRID